MVEIRVYLVSPWEELENALRQNLREVKIMPFLNCEGPLLKFPFSESSNAWSEFFDQWALIQPRCSDEVKELIDSIFFSGFKPVMNEKSGKIEKWELGLFDLPFDRYSYDANEELREIVLALNPETIERMAKAVAEFDINLCASYFGSKSSKKFETFDDLFEYSQVWLDYIQQANQCHAGIIVTFV